MSDAPVTGQVAVPFVLMRGGTSKAVFLRGGDLPTDPTERDRLILALFGSPDPRQIDGLGGADLLTSKLAVIDPPSRSDADLDYTFGQVSITAAVVDYDINCGNISAAVGAYAIDEGLVEVREPSTRVRIHNTNTGRVLVADVPVEHGRAAVAGDLAIDGVPGTGAPILLDYSDTAGGATGALLPTGNATDTLKVEISAAGVPVVEAVRASIVDLGNLSVFFSAAEVGMTGTEGPGDLTDENLAAIAAVKQAAADLIGISGDGLVPVPVVVAAAETGLVARVIGGRPAVLHRAYPGTVAACTAVAAAIAGTTVSEIARGDSDGLLAIGHPSGTMPARAQVRSDGSGWVVETAAYLRTARRLAEGRAFVSV
jgi:methylitaconate Delta-isomerase